MTRIHRARFSLRAGLVLIITVQTLLLGGPALAAGTGSTCAYAQTLTGDAMPARALALIESVEAAGRPVPKDCGPARDSAMKALTDSASAVAAARQNLLNRNWKEAVEHADAALKIDSENASAAEIKKAATAELPATSAPSEAKSAWSDFLARYVTPVVPVSLAFLAVLAGLLVASRFTTTLWVRWPKLPGPVRVAILMAGVITCMLASAVATLGVSQAAYSLGLRRGWTDGWWSSGLGLNRETGIIGGSLALIGVALVAVGLATRLRLHVEVRGKDGATNQASTGHVIALLRELGAEKPRDIEAPRGADVETLSGGVITAASKGKVAKALAAIVQLLMAGVTWRVAVDEESDDSLSVIVTRNGRTAGSAVIERDALGLGAATPPGAGSGNDSTAKAATKPDLHRLAAAVVLTTLADHHKYGFEGLCGGRDWRSLGLQYIATTDLRGTDEAKSLLARAVEYDPDNMLAQVAYQHALFRDSTDPIALGAYAEWLALADEPLNAKGHGDLRRRVLLTRVIALVNRYYATKENEREKSLQGVFESADALVDCLKQSRESSRIAEQSKPIAAVLALWACDHARNEDPQAVRRLRETVQPWIEDRHLARLSVGGHYNLACYEATHNDSGDGTETAITHLRLVQSHPDYGPWMKQDPQLTALVATPQFRTTFGRAPESDFLALTPLLPFAQQLRKVGITTAADLASYTDYPALLRGHLPVDLPTAARLVRLGVLGASVPEGLSAFSVELCAELLKLGKADTIHSDPRAVVPVSDYAAKICDAIAKRCDARPPDAKVEAWLHRWSLGSIARSAASNGSGASATLTQTQ